MLSARLKISRHARRRMKRYGVDETEVSAALESPDSTVETQGGAGVLKTFAGRFSGYPLKVV